MNKSERITEMMIYLNNKDYFNLKNLMERYSISKSTALRDVQSLEAIGMPIYSEQGRNGRYGILKNRLLSPIIFTVDEMYSLYFAMLTLDGYQSTPFHLDLSKLKSKFESCIAEQHIINLKKMENIFSLASYEHPNSSPFLKDILETAIENKVSSITYKKGNKNQIFKVQFFDISSSFGQWYTTAYNHETERIQVFRCDKITAFSRDTNLTPVSIDNIKSASSNIYKNKDAIEVFITEKGVDLFFKENYPSMSLHYKDEKPLIRGFYNNGEEDFISNYFSSYGQEIISIYPQELKVIVTQKVEQNLEHYRNL